MRDDFGNDFLAGMVYGVFFSIVFRCIVGMVCSMWRDAVVAEVERRERAKRTEEWMRTVPSRERPESA